MTISTKTDVTLVLNDEFTTPATKALEQFQKAADSVKPPVFFIPPPRPPGERRTSANDAADQFQTVGFDETAKQANEANRELDNLTATARKFDGVMASAFEKSIVHGQGFTSVLSRLENQIVNMTTKLLFTKPLENVLGGIFEKVFSAGLLPGMADGGSISAFQTVVVGERGPEIFTPTTSGDITPNHKIGGDTITNHFNIVTPDAQSFRANRGAILAEFGQAMERGNRNR